MRGHTYPDLALRYEVGLCSDYGCECRSRRGSLDDQEPMILHWDDEKRITRSGLRRFLMLVQRATDRRSWDRMSALERRAIEIHAASVFATKEALALGIRLPAYLSRQDRARVRALLSGAPTELRRSKVGRWAGLR